MAMCLKLNANKDFKPILTCSEKSGRRNFVEHGGQTDFIQNA